VKEKFRTHIGTPVEHQRLILRERGQQIGELTDNHRMLGFYSVASGALRSYVIIYVRFLRKKRLGMEIHVVDTDPFSLSRGGGLTDVSLVNISVA
jgi:tubulin-folding cofactor B